MCYAIEKRTVQKKGREAEKIRMTSMKPNEREPAAGVETQPSWLGSLLANGGTAARKRQKEKQLEEV